MVYTCAQLLMPLGVSRALSKYSNLLKIYPVPRFRKGQQKVERDHRNKTPRIWRKKERTAGKKLAKKRFMFLRSLIYLLFLRSRSLEHKRDKILVTTSRDSNEISSALSRPPFPLFLQIPRVLFCVPLSIFCRASYLRSWNRLALFDSDSLALSLRCAILVNSRRQLQSF